jgi:hypothetical protein
MFHLLRSLNSPQFIWRHMYYAISNLTTSDKCNLVTHTQSRSKNGDLQLSLKRKQFLQRRILTFHKEIDTHNIFSVKEQKGPQYKNPDTLHLFALI